MLDFAFFCSWRRSGVVVSEMDFNVRVALLACEAMFAIETYSASSAFAIFHSFTVFSFTVFSFQVSVVAVLAIWQSSVFRRPAQTTERPNDRTTERPNDQTTERPNDRTTKATERQSDKTAKRQNDKMTKWQNAFLNCSQ